MPRPVFVLASASPARRRLLQTAGLDPRVAQSDFDESLVQLEDVGELVQTLALKKAQTVAQRLITGEIPREDAAPYLVMGCDSVLWLAGQVQGKPADAADAIARWQQMRGQTGSLYTGHALLEIPATQPRTVAQTLVRDQVTQVQFAQVSDREIQDYVATGEPLNCAGCFALEGRGGLFVEKLEGCHTNVIGLSLPLLRRMMQQLGYEISNFW